MSEEKTNARAIEYLAHYKNVKYGLMPEWVWDMAIKALEQEPVLDKIRAEIVQMPTISFNANDIYKADVLAIIDKYKAESEDKE